jgi:hypothetical protein
MVNFIHTTPDSDMSQKKSVVTKAKTVGMAIRGRVPGTRRVPTPRGPGMRLIFHPWVRGG